MLTEFFFFFWFMPRAKENSYIFVSPGFVWPLQACWIGVLLWEGPCKRQEQSGQQGKGRGQASGCRGMDAGRDTVAKRFDVPGISSRRDPPLPFCLKAIWESQLKGRFPQSGRPVNDQLPLFSHAAASFSLELDRLAVFSSILSRMAESIQVWQMQMGASKEGLCSYFSLELP